MFIAFRLDAGGRLITSRRTGRGYGKLGGLDLLAQQNPDAARPYLEWVRDHGKRSKSEFIIVLHELSRLDNKKD